jgi:hypothetical protein
MTPSTEPQFTPPDLDQVTSNIRRRPLRALTLAAGAGFMLGGGLRTRLGVALGLFLGRTFAGNALVNAIETVANQNGRQHRANQKRVGRGAEHPQSDSHRNQSEGRRAG